MKETTITFKADITMTLLKNGVNIDINTEDGNDKINELERRIKTAISKVLMKELDKSKIHKYSVEVDEDL